MKQDKRYIRIKLRQDRQPFRWEDRRLPMGGVMITPGVEHVLPADVYFFGVQRYSRLIVNLDSPSADPCVACEHSAASECDFMPDPDSGTATCRTGAVTRELTDEDRRALRPWWVYRDRRVQVDSETDSRVNFTDDAGKTGWAAAEAWEKDARREDGLQDEAEGEETAGDGDENPNPEAPTPPPSESDPDAGERPKGEEPEAETAGDGEKSAG